jgi:pilus assembly protein CpaB
MNSRAFTLSLIIACFSMWMVYAYIEGKEADFKAKFGKDMPVVVAKINIKELELLDDSKITTKSVPRKFIAPRAFRKVEDVFNKIAAVPIAKDEQITAPRILNPGVRTGLSRQVSVGKRAMSINVSGSQAVSRLLKPGDRVDIITFVDYAGGKKDKVKSKTILQDVFVLSTGRNITNNIPLIGLRTDKAIKKLNLNTYSNFNEVTLEVDPFQAQKLLMLINLGTKPYLTLRNNNDKSITRIKSTDIYDLLGEDRNEAKQYFSEKALREKRSK